MHSHNDTAIAVRNLVKIFERRNSTPVRALDGVSFTVRRGEIFGLLGPNGAGKTTTIRILTTLLKPTGGRAIVGGHDVQLSPLEVRKQLCVVLQDNAVELYLSVIDNLKTFGRFHGMGRQEVQTRMAQVLGLFGLDDVRHAKAIDLSGGIKRRLQVAKVFLVDKPIVFLDEATTGMDALNKRATLRAIREEASKGRTIVLTTHILEEAEELCDQLAIINHGTIAASGSVETVKALGLGFLTLKLEFAKVPATLLKWLKGLDPLRIETKGSLVEMTISKETNLISLLSRINKERSITSFQVTGASLEDVFVELLDKQKGSLA
jgi:ABC-2 type transport system ATP-binding protein